MQIRQHTRIKLWNSGKIKFKEMRGCSRLYIQSYLDEFLWRHNNKVTRHEAFIKIFEDIVKVCRTVVL